LLCLFAWRSAAEERYITVASTTSTQNSGLYGFILPKFTEKTDIGIRVVAVGTGQAIRLAGRGDADVLFVHHRPSEEKFVADGFGVKRYEVMYNDFIVVGPTLDPAGIRGMTDVVLAFERIAKVEAPFVSRGDDSGTHKMELSLWKDTDIDIGAASGSWYREAGASMGATLNTAVGMDTYTLTDRASWLNFKNRGDLGPVVENDPRLFNYYGVILVNKRKHPHVKARLGQAFIDWIISAEGQKAIAEFKLEGRQAFFPNAKRQKN
jgi:tungstate transport system substrate-binding protein